MVVDEEVDKEVCTMVVDANRREGGQGGVHYDGLSLQLRLLQKVISCQLAPPSL